MWNLVLAPLERRSAETMAERNARWADFFQNAANTYVEALVRATSSLEVAGHIYAHLFTAHFPALIRKYGDLRPYSGESTEALGKIQKRSKNNGRQMGSTGKSGTVMQHGRDGQVMANGTRKQWAQNKLGDRAVAKNRRGEPNQVVATD